MDIRWSGSQSVCLEVDYNPMVVAIRDTENRTAGTFTVPEPTWHAVTSHFRSQWVKSSRPAQIFSFATSVSKSSATSIHPGSAR
ncbi:hypothetical protein DMH04_52645 [Kibdelosporangium aridum]|uniref:DUF397 domain-containing protein n=1 Tax=Kibdelosporangium aridum TaxID=2030 RepID=A0A428Y3Y8_KIBAR|nr:hypothetical protein DMH04_52645 [Kibdelosporangium aridum]